MIEAGVDLLEVQKILGHHSILTTARYTHLSCRTKRNAEQAINGQLNALQVMKSCRTSASPLMRAE